MSSSIYNHRSLQPQGPPPGPVPAHSPTRLTESLEAVRQEFELAASDITLLRGQRDEFENRIHAQINELNHIKQMVYELENQHTKARQQYDDEVNRLRAELTQARQAAAVQAQQAQQAQVQAQQAQAQGLPPHPSTAGSGAGGGGGGPPPPPGALPPPANTSPHVAHAGMGHPGPGYGEPPYGYRGGREDVREREIRDVRDARDGRGDVRGEREMLRERELRDARGDLRDVRDVRGDRELRERDVRDRDVRERDAREVKRIKTERPKEYPPPSSGHKPYPESAGPSTALVSSSSTLPPPSGPTPYPPPPPPSSSGGGAFLDDINPETLPPEFKKEGSDWFAVFNPKVKRVLDVNLMNTLSHESVVCCVRFSADGKYLATGCNRTAQIYEVKTGQKVCVLNDESASPVGDLYIRSVCFSPDGKLLATGAEDKTIRIWEIAKKRVKRVFEGHQQEIYSLDFSKNGRLIVSGSGDRTTRIWDMETGMQKVLEINEPDGVDAGVTSVAISPDGRLVAAGSLDTVVRIWEVQTGNLVERLKGHRDSVYSVAFTPDGKGIVSGSLDKTLKHWDISAIVSGGSRKDPLPTPSSSSSEGAANGAVVRKDTASTTNNAVNNPNGGAGDRGSLNTLNFTGHKDYVLSVAVSHDGQWVVSGSKDRGVQFWEASSASNAKGGAGGGVQVQCMLQGHKNSVISIDLSPTGGVLATGSGDMQARLWSYTTI